MRSHAGSGRIGFRAKWRTLAPESRSHLLVSENLPLRALRIPASDRGLSATRSVVVRAQNVGFEVLGRGKPWTAIRSLVPGCCDFPILVKKSQHRQAPAGIVGRAFCIFVLYFCRVRPAFASAIFSVPTLAKPAAQLKFHLALLTDATATSQQLPITHNNFRLFARDQGCVPLLAVLSTACSAAASGRSAGVVGEEKEKN